MKKLLCLLALSSVVSACAGDPDLELCRRNAECLGYTEEQRDDVCERDEEDGDDSPPPNDCNGEETDVKWCVLDNGTCDEVPGSDAKVFGLDAIAEDGPCADQLDARSTCYETCTNCD